MFTILGWVIFGFIVGWIAKLIHPGDEPSGCLPTIALGIAGSFVGGLINWILGFSVYGVHPAGFLMSIVGAILCCAAWRYYVLKNSDNPRSFFTGRKLR